MNTLGSLSGNQAVQHAKAGLQEEYQSNWLNENQKNQIVTDAFTQAKDESFVHKNLLHLKKLPHDIISLPTNVSNLNDFL